MSDTTMQQVLIRMPSEMYEEVKRRAENEDRTIAAEVRRAVRRYLEGDLQPV
jgi:predicted DNA-binding protein